ncbi:MAG: hypothetical protein COV37_19215 [Bdellovibrio sp. CG11_big_fil_rev_8_21_14_0_20_39_38]|nr:MAG: hypothetical protein COW78_04665 [Bdellovibrio sp. CG22_combo_CG10-13_8_21_14_all_39_27]PIR32682.1 MAG: hypothetical protein COV37_19215 [Bdellovibrio sp. CG11_big_fil_rev_8_21_14_0_20_39_38]
MKRLISAILCYSLLISSSYAFEISDIKARQYKLSQPSEFIFQSNRDEELISIRLLGEVQRAGLYHVPKNLKLITLLSLAGGTTNNANLNEVLIGNDLHGVKDNETGKKQESLVLDLEKTLENNPKNDYALQTNDIVLVKPRTSLISNDTFRLVTVISVILTSALTVLAIEDRRKN